MTTRYLSYIAALRSAVQTMWRASVARSSSRTARLRLGPFVAHYILTAWNTYSIRQTTPSILLAYKIALSLDRCTMTRTISGLHSSRWSPNSPPQDAPALVPSSLATSEPRKDGFKPENFGQPFCDFLTKNPTVFHAVDAFAKELMDKGFSKLSERENWKLKKGGKYFIERNGSSMVAFVVGEKYEPGNGAAMIAGHVDALTAKLKPIPKLENKAGFVQLGVAPYAGGLNDTWW